MAGDIHWLELGVAPEDTALVQISDERVIYHLRELSPGVVRIEVGLPGKTQELADVGFIFREWVDRAEVQRLVQEWQVTQAQPPGDESGE